MVVFFAASLHAVENSKNPNNFHGEGSDKTTVSNTRNSIYLRSLPISKQTFTHNQILKLGYHVIVVQSELNLFRQGEEKTRD